MYFGMLGEKVDDVVSKNVLLGYFIVLLEVIRIVYLFWYDWVK